MVSIARKNLFHDKIRFLIALAGIQLSVLLITIQVGVFLRFLTNASVLIDNATADIWITAKNLQNFDFGRPFSEKKVYQARNVPGVLWAEKYLIAFGYWKTPAGSQESVQVIGFNPQTMVGAPWDVVEGDLRDAKEPFAVFYDVAEADRLGRIPVGGVTEVNNRRVRVAGITRGAKSFIQAAYVFTSYKNASNLAFFSRGDTVYSLVKVADGYEVDAVVRRLRETLQDVDVYTKEEFSYKTRYYWMINTGAGIALLSVAIMGLVIGTIIVGQTIYASTTEHLKEFGTLKAIGASNGDIYKIIIQQALINSVIGFVLGMLATYGVVQIMKVGKLEVLLTPPILICIFLVTVLMCLVSSILSIYKVTKIDPALIFKS